jgi:hypothetical protein
MTLSMNGSLIFLAVGIGLFIWLFRQPVDPALVPTEPEPEPKTPTPEPAAGSA